MEKWQVLGRGPLGRMSLKGPGVLESPEVLGVGLELNEAMSEGLWNQPERAPSGQSWDRLNDKVTNGRI